MMNEFKQLLDVSSQPRFHRIKLIPLAEVLETESKVKVLRPNGMKQQEKVLLSSLLDVKQQKTTLLEPANQTEVLDTLDLAINDPDITLPRLATIGRTHQQGQLSSRVKSEKPEALDLSIDDDSDATLPRLRVVIDTSIEQDEPSTEVKSEKLEFFDPDIDYDSELEKHATIPANADKSVSNQQNLPASAIQAEISDVASGGTFVGLGAIWGYLLGYGFNFLLQRGLGARRFGLYSLASSIVRIITSLFSLGLDDAMTRYVAIYRGKQQKKLLRNLTIFCTALAGGAGILGALLVLHFAPLLITTLGEKPRIIPILQIMIPMIPLACVMMVWASGLQGFKEFKKIALLGNIVGTVEFPVLALVLFLFPHVVKAVALEGLFSVLITTVLYLYLLFRTISQMSGSGPEKYEVREWLGFATPNLLTSIVDIVLDTTDTLLLAYFAIPYLGIGQYNAAIKISGFIAMPLSMLNKIFAPMIAELHSKGEKQKLEAMFKLVTKWAITLSLPIFGIAILFSASLLALSGDSFIAAWPLLIIFAIGGMTNVATGSVGLMLLMTGHQKFSFLNSLAAVIANVVLGIILTPRYGVMGTAISTALATCIINLMRLLQVFLLLKIQPYQWSTLKPLGAGLISVVLTTGLLYLLSLAHLSIQIFHWSVFINLALIPVFLAMYVGLLALLKTSPEDEIVLDVLRRKLKLNNRQGKK
jgi:O-antigen/teichoic acid export membrane protein